MDDTELCREKSENEGIRENQIITSSRERGDKVRVHVFINELFKIIKILQLVVLYMYLSDS
jgi:hypothetical protein